MESHHDSSLLAGISAGIALLLAVGLLALLFAFGVFSPQGTPGVSAHVCQSPNDEHTDISGDDECVTDPTALADTNGSHAAGDHTVPVFSMETYSFNIDEGKAGDTTPVSLGQVMATHAEGDSFGYFVSDTTNYRIYPNGSLAFIGADTVLDFEATTGLETDEDGKYVEIMVAAVEGATPTAPTWASITDAQREVTGLATVKVYVNDVEAPPPTGLTAEPDKGTPAVGTTAAIAASPTSIDVMWDRHPNVIDGADYTVRYREMKDGQADDEGWTSVDLDIPDVDGTGDADHPNMTTITGLKAKTDYEVQVRVTNSATDDIADMWSDVVVGETVSPPAAVKIVVTSEGLGSGELMVSWTNDDADSTMHDGGGDSKATYLVEYGERRSFDPNQDHTLRSFKAMGSSTTIQGLNNGTLYHVRVTPLNRVFGDDKRVTDTEPNPDIIETDAALEARLATVRSDPMSGTPYGKPSAPRNLQVVAVDQNTLLANWQAPSDMGGYDSVSYYVTYQKDGDASTTMTMEDVAATSINLSGLEAETLYQVRVMATNDSGDSQAAIAFGRTTKAPSEVMVPGLVQDIAVRAISGSELFVSWNPPSSVDPRGPVTGYSVQYRAVDTTAWMDVQREGTDVGQTITGLDAATTYVVRVAAMNSKGTGGYVRAASRTMDGPTPSAAPCLENLSGDGSFSGQWARRCDSTDRAGRHARFYTFTLAQESEVTINLVSDIDTYLYLRGGEATSGTTINDHVDDDDAGDGTNSLTEETLSAGTYTIEATTYQAGKAGSFTLTVVGLGTRTSPQPPPAAPCLENLANDMRISGQWASGCDSIDRAGRHARFYTFTMPQESEITITLESSEADAYLYLRAGEVKSGVAVNDHSEDDDASEGTNSQIKESLAAGTYTIEATTYNTGESGFFTLTLLGLAGTAPEPPPTADCGKTLSADGTVSGTWAEGCASEAEGRGYARYYTFTLDQESEVTITLESSEADAYLYLRAGEAKSGAAVNEHVEDDDAGGGTNSQIEETLPAGTYTIEATTYHAAETGSFTLILSGLGTTT